MGMDTVVYPTLDHIDNVILKRDLKENMDASSWPSTLAALVSISRPEA